MKNWSTKPGVYADIPNDVYHADREAVSKSQLDQLARSPMHFRHALDNPAAPTPDLSLGSAVHTLVLEPELFDQEFIRLPEFDRRSKADKQRYAEFAVTHLPKEKTDLAQGFADGTIKAGEFDRLFALYAKAAIITQEQWDQAHCMAERALSHPAVAWLLQDATVETTLTWRDDEKQRARVIDLMNEPVDLDATHIRCRARVDIRKPHEGGAIYADLKTTIDASPEAFARSSDRYRYHVQAAMYSDGGMANGEAPGHFAFVCIEKSEPYAVAVYRIVEAAVDLGRELYIKDLRTLATCRAKDYWPAYSDSVLDLDLPSWAYGRAA